MNFQFLNHLWEHRLLVVFTPDENSDTYLNRMEYYRGHNPGFRDRDLLLLTSFSDTNGNIRTVPGNKSEILKPSSARTFRNRFQVRKNQFSIILIGKDGTLKLKKQKIVSTAKIFNTIDAMPMRQREIKENS